MKNKQHSYCDAAVSPVVGVLLMLVVTIIIAAVVSGFAGGLAGSQSKTPQASIVASDFTIKDARCTDSTGMGQGVPAPNNPGTGKAADIYVVFEHKGGDSFNLANVELKLSSLQKPGEKTTVTNANTPLTNTHVYTFASGSAPVDPGIGDKSLISGFSQNWARYMERLTDHGSIVKSGDKFVVHADYASLYKGVKSINWLHDAGTYPFFVNEGDVLTYQVVDKPTGREIASGQIAVPEFSVTTT